MKRAIELQNLPEKPTDRMYLLNIHGGKCDGVHLAKRVGTKKWIMICAIPGTNILDDGWVFVGNYPNLKKWIEDCNPLKIHKIWEIKPDIKPWEYRRIIMNLLVHRDPNTTIEPVGNTLIFKDELERSWTDE